MHIWHVISEIFKRAGMNVHAGSDTWNQCDVYAELIKSRFLYAHLLDFEIEGSLSYVSIWK